MGTTAEATKTRTLQRRRIIQRPRLLALLDESNARVRMLVAAAGYGKTTLAEQWVAADGRRSAWFTVRRASVDVAGLALGLARSCSGIVPQCDERLRAHLKAVSAPAGSSTVLAEILCEDLADWPEDAWLVIDDYQEISGSGEAENFVADLIAGCPLRVVLTSRQRPSWVTARSILYGEVLEVGQALLAMDPQEAAEVLAGWSGPAASGLVALANGWPAVIGLASVSSAEIESEGDAAVPESLYRFFAEEVFDALDHVIRDGLTHLALAPVLDRVLAAKLLGEHHASLVCDRAVDVGLVVERDSRLELHPLARSFLQERIPSPARSAIEICLRHYRQTHDWDAAYDVIVRRGAPDALEDVLEAALDDLLDSARLSTIEEWCDRAAAGGIDRPIFAVARAETALRHGRQAHAQAYAEAAADSTELAFRALSVAGRAAHLASHEEIALELYRRSEHVAKTERDRREARWNQVMTAADLDIASARQLLHELRGGVTPLSPREFVKAMTCSLSLAARSGEIDPQEAAIAWDLVPALGDPLVETSFESIYSHTLALVAQYDRALEVATTLLSTAHKYRLDFAIPHGHGSAAMAYVGLRQWEAARESIHRARKYALDSKDSFAEGFAFALSLRSLAQQGEHTAAAALPMPDLSVAPPILRSDVLASRAFALAVADHLDEASELIARVAESRIGAESLILSEATAAVISLKRNRADALERVHRTAEVAFSSGAVDLLVTVYRSVPLVLEVLMRDPRDSHRVRMLVEQARDNDLARALGVSATQGDRHASLSPREREVYNLLCDGLSNRQIAAILVISPSTAKLHVQHVYDKLGVHSRQALAVHAALERSRHATSATRASDFGLSSDV